MEFFPMLCRAAARILCDIYLILHRRMMNKQKKIASNITTCNDLYFAHFILIRYMYKFSCPVAFIRIACFRLHCSCMHRLFECETLVGKFVRNFFIRIVFSLRSLFFVFFRYLFQTIGCAFIAEKKNERKITHWITTNTVDTHTPHTHNWFHRNNVDICNNKHCANITKETIIM